MASEEMLEIVLDLCGALEAAAVDAKQRIAKLVGVKAWDPAHVSWIQAEGSRGPYERSEDVNNREFKAMVKDLAAHGGRLTRENYFYWLFESGDIVGRKRRRGADSS